MGLSDTIRKGVALANKLTSDLQVSPEKDTAVMHEVWEFADETGEPQYAAPVARKALVDWARKMVSNTAGETRISRAVITFLEPTEVDERDRFTLPDGTIATVLDISGFIDSQTGRPYAVEVLLA